MVCHLFPVDDEGSNSCTVEQSHCVRHNADRLWRTDDLYVHRVMHMNKFKTLKLGKHVRLFGSSYSCVCQAQVVLHTAVGAMLMVTAF